MAPATTPLPGGHKRRPYAAAASLLALLGWLVLPALHGAHATAPCSAHGTEAAHAHEPCCDHDHAAQHEGQEPDDGHDPATCALCRLALLTPSGPISLAAHLPLPARTFAAKPPAPGTTPRAAPPLTDAPPRGPPAHLAV
jgi:hypothetical protein